jgi:hypothetical protein
LKLGSGVACRVGALSSWKKNFLRVSSMPFMTPTTLPWPSKHRYMSYESRPRTFRATLHHCRRLRRPSKLNSAGYQRYTCVARLDAVSPGDLAELERTQKLLHATEYSLELAKQMSDGSVHGRVVTLLPLELSGGRAVDNAEKSATLIPFPMDDPDFVAGNLRAVLDRLQGEVMMDRDNLALRGLVALTVPFSVNEQKASGGAQASLDPSRPAPHPPQEDGRQPES